MRQSGRNGRTEVVDLRHVDAEVLQKMPKGICAYCEEMDVNECIACKGIKQRHYGKRRGRLTDVR